MSGDGDMTIVITDKVAIVGSRAELFILRERISEAMIYGEADAEYLVEDLDIEITSID
jgi:hypothetical protein